MKKKRRKIKRRNEDLGTCAFHCKQCDIEFEVDWMDIFSLQEGTHGFVGFDLYEEYIPCPKCGENANEQKVEEESIMAHQDIDPAKNLPF